MISSMISAPPQLPASAPSQECHQQDESLQAMVFQNILLASLKDQNRSISRAMRTSPCKREEVKNKSHAFVN